MAAAKTPKRVLTPEEELAKFLQGKAARGLPATLEQTQRLTCSVLGEVRR
jgi:hypothetical protein